MTTALAATAAIVVLAPAAAHAAWSKSGDGTSSAKGGTLGTPTLPAPTCTSDTPDSTHNRITLDWTDVTNATSYDVYRRVGTTGSFTLLKNVSTSTTTDDVSQTVSTVTNYEVLARVGTNWVSPFSAVRSETNNNGNGKCGTLA